MSISMNGVKQMRDPLDYPNYVQALRTGEPELAEALAGFHGVEDVLQWMQARELCRAPVDIVGQDEFNYDFLIQVEPQGRWLAFGVT